MSQLRDPKRSRDDCITPRFRKDRLGRIRFRPQALSSHGAARVRLIQEAILNGIMDDENVRVQIAAHLLCFEGILLQADLSAAIKNWPSIFKWDGHHVLEWTRADGRQDRRFLSALSAGMAACDPGALSDRDFTAVTQHLARVLYSDPSADWSRLFTDLQAYYLEALPGYLFAHVTALLPMTALPRSALARLETGLALVDDMVAALAASEAALGNALEAFLSGPAESSSAWLVDRILKICHEHSRRDNPQDKINMLKAFLDLTLQPLTADAISMLILSWAIDMAEAGTVAERNPRPRTIAKYLRLIAHMLREHFLGKDLVTLEMEAFHASYLEIIKGTSEGSRGNCISALKSWHAFLVNWVGVAPLEEKLAADDVAIIPAANILCAHELARIHAWLDHSCLDERMREQLHLSLHVSSAIRLRASELFHLRMRNIVDHGDVIEVEVAPMIRDGRPKSTSSRRCVVLNDPVAASGLRRWVGRRRIESAMDEDLLLGDPQSPDRVYRLGQLYVLLNRLLRDSSGERDISFHTLSHTWASNRYLQAMMGPARLIDVNPLEVIARDAGHLSSRTTLFHYIHTYGEPLLNALQNELSHLSLTSAVAARWSGVRADTLRQRVHALQKHNLEVYWEAIWRRPMQGIERTAATGLTLCMPAIPSYLMRATALRFDAVLGAVKDVCEGLPSNAVMARNGLSEDQLALLRESLSAHVARLRLIRSRQGRRVSGVGPYAEQNSCQGAGTSGIDFRRISQTKWDAVRQAIGSHGNDDDLVRVISAWAESFDRGYLDLKCPEGASGLFRFISRCAIPTTHLAIAVGRGDPARPTLDEQRVEASLASLFERYFSLPPMLDIRKSRRSRPNYFLIWSGRPLRSGHELPVASTSLGGFHALMLVTGVFTDMRRAANKESNHAC